MQDKFNTGVTMPVNLIVSKHAISATVTLFGGAVNTGQFFLASASPMRGGMETLLDLLNDVSRSFVPFKTPNGMVFLNREAIRSVDFEAPNIKDIFFRPDNEFIYSIKVYVRTDAGGGSYQGVCFTGDLSPEHRRPLDLLNTNDLFLLLFSDDKLALINKKAISHIEIE